MQFWILIDKQPQIFLQFSSEAKTAAGLLQLTKEQNLNVVVQDQEVKIQY